jgi:dUTP pyrophosphatase
MKRLLRFVTGCFVKKMQLRVKRLVPQAVLPTRQSEGAAGYDLTSVEDVEIQPGQRACVSTGLSMAIPEGYYGRIAPRSGLAAKNGLQVGAGVIDSDYRGLVKVLLFNHGSEPVWLPPNSRIAQLIFEKIGAPEVLEVENLDDTVRGEGGFGSTGQS